MIEDKSSRSKIVSDAGPSSNKEEQLGMGAVSKSSKSTLGPVTSASSDSSHDSSRSFGRRQRKTSSDSRSSSAGDDSSIYEKGSSRSANTTATSVSSSDADHTFEKQRRSVEEKSAVASFDPGNRAVEQAIGAEAQSGIARDEEASGRPELEVEDLKGAIEKGVDLDGADEAANQSPATSFEQSSAHVVLQATVTSLTPTHIVVQSNEEAAAEKTGGKKKLWSIDSVSIPYSHMIYALGSHLPDPLRTEARTKEQGVNWMRDIQARVKSSREVVLVGGGALGVEFSADIKSVYPDKKVTLIHSRKQLLPNFHEKVHEVALKRLHELGVDVVLGERLALTQGCPMGSTVTDQVAVTDQTAVCTPGDAKGEGSQAHKEGICVGYGRKLVKTTGGKEFECDLLLLCTGQQPNSSLMAQLSPTSVDSRTRLVRVLRTLQVQVPLGKDGMAPMPFDPTPPCGDCDCFLDKKAEGVEDREEAEIAATPQGCLSNVYAIGDVADAFGALNAGYQAWNMADVAADNIIRDIAISEEKGALTDEKRHSNLQHFTPAANMLKLSLGLGQMVFQGLPAEDGIPVVEIKEDPHDLAVEGVWEFMAGMSTDDLYL
jgi:NADH dehydrogenase FAD-containing subunit